MLVRFYLFLMIMCMYYIAYNWLRVTIYFPAAKDHGLHRAKKRNRITNMYGAIQIFAARAKSIHVACLLASMNDDVLKDCAKNDRR